MATGWGLKGLTLDAQVKVIDLGGLLTRLGHKDAVSGGGQYWWSVALGQYAVAV
ncbi:hypothetical protein N7E01_15695 [Neopusillimonas aromaticivorans]|nr:hypothetical protein [Neopusillimonas aromaticivorans]WJJ93391.1 hypothetical protein N7E01_15695 [Neopusillimonas aromaticivorans]